MKRLLAKISLLLMGLAPSLAFAQAATGDNISDGLSGVSFTPALTDKSVDYLSQLFGTVSGVLHGTSGDILGRLFEAFNYGVLVVAGFFLIYTILSTVINTAQDGQFMGQKFNSAWVVIRTIMGLSLLIPKFSGYSMIQVIVLWVVVQGVGLANIGWDKALTYLQDGQAVHTKPMKVPPPLVGIMGKILVAQVCSYKSGLNRNSTGTPKIMYNASARTVTFPNGCGVINYGKDADPASYKGPSTGTPKIPSATGNGGTKGTPISPVATGSGGTNEAESSQMSVNSYTEDAIQQVITSLRAPAKQVARAMNENKSLSESEGNQVVSSLVGASADYLNLIQPARKIVQKRQGAMTDDYFGQARKDGWIMAGRYYYAISSIKSASRESLGSYLPKVSLPSQPGSVLDDSSAVLDRYIIEAQDAVAGAMGLPKQGASGSMAEGSNASGQVKSMMNMMDEQMGDAMNPENSDSTDPILALQGMGQGMINGAMAIWIVGAVSSAVAGVAGIWGAINPGGYIAANVVNWMVLFAFGIATMLFTTGVMLAVYLPLIPFIIFSFAALGWMIAVLEAVVAGPLVALGVTHPEGHDWLGKGEQAIMLLLSIFLRPILMIIGLIAAMVLSRVFIGFLSDGFWAVMGDIQAGGGISGVANIAAIFIFASLSVTVVNVVYAGCIVDLTHKVMVWIGLQPQTDRAVDQALAAGKDAAMDYSKGAAATGGAGGSKMALGHQKAKPEAPEPDAKD